MLCNLIGHYRLVGASDEEVKVMSLSAPRNHKSTLSGRASAMRDMQSRVSLLTPGT